MLTFLSSGGRSACEQIRIARPFTWSRRTIFQYGSIIWTWRTHFREIPSAPAPVIPITLQISAWRLARAAYVCVLSSTVASYSAKTAAMLRGSAAKLPLKMASVTARCSLDPSPENVMYLFAPRGPFLIDTIDSGERLISERTSARPDKRSSSYPLASSEIPSTPRPSTVLN